MCFSLRPIARYAFFMSAILIFYGSYRSDRQGIRLARFLIERLSRRGHAVELVDAREVGLPILDRMFKEFPAGEAPVAMAALAQQLVNADGFVFITGEYNWGVQPGLKNLTDHFLEEWFFRPAAIASYSAGRLSGVRAASAWHPTLGEMGMVVVPSTITVGQIGQSLTEDGIPAEHTRLSIERAFDRFAADLEWWMEAASAQRAVKPPPY